MRQMTMRQTTATSVSIPVRVAALPGEWQFQVTAYVNPAGKTSRLAKSNEVEVRIQYEWGWAAWTTDSRWIRRTDTNGRAVVTMNVADMRFAGKYRIEADHLASGARVHREVHLDAAGNPTVFGQTVDRVGTEMPFDFAQRARMGQGVPGHLAIPEIIQWPRTGKRGFHGVEVPVRQQGGYAEYDPIV